MLFPVVLDLLYSARAGSRRALIAIPPLILLWANLHGGWIVGAGAVAAFAMALGRQQAPPLPLGWMALCGVILVALLHGTRWHVEPAVRHVAWLFRLALPFCR